MNAVRVQIATLGCKVNAYDTATIADRLRAAGCQLVEAGESADVVIVNSCTVTDAADAESRRLARRARRANPAARVILTGCYAQTRPAEAAALEAVDHVVGLNRLDALVTAVLTGAGSRIMVGNGRRERAFLKVQEGCDLFCTFCIVPMARGRSRSLAPRAVLAEVEALAAAGFQEVVLTGVHLGGYGADLDPPVDLAWLVAAIAEQGLVPRLRLSSIDPHEVSEALLRVMAGTPAVCPHLHVPLQAADDGVLARMRRRYDSRLARERLAMIRDYLPDAAIGTDLIAGFPGEDDAAFARTLTVLGASPLTYFHVFPYSVRSGTTAAKLPGQHGPATIRARARELRALGERKRAAFVRRFDGSDAELLVETTRYTRNYLRACIDGPDDWQGRRLGVRLTVGPGSAVTATARGGT